MSWPALLVLPVAAYGLKALGPVLVAQRTIGPEARAVLDLIAVPVLRG